MEVNTAALHHTGNHLGVWTQAHTPAPLEQLDRGAQVGIVGRHRKTHGGSAQRGPGLCQFEPMCVTKVVLGVADPGQDGWSRTWATCPGIPAELWNESKDPRAYRGGQSHPDW